MWKRLGYLAGIGVVTEVIYQLYKYRFKRNMRKESERNTEVLFFPDEKVACIKYFTDDEQGCQNKNCKFTHEDNSLSRLFKHIHRSSKSLDVCVFVLSCSDLIDLLIAAAKRGIKVRVITDCDQVDIPGSQVWKLRSEGIAVRTDDSSFFMHHKFMIIDNKTLLNGSFNWTRNAIMGNQENLMITMDPKLVDLFKMQFMKLWNQYKPLKGDVEKQSM